MRRPILAGAGILLFLAIAFVLVLAIPVATQEPGPRFSAWSQAVSVGPKINTPDYWEGCPFIAKDGLDLYFRAEVYEPSWSFDIFVSHRDSVDAPWGTPVNLGPNINTTKNELCSFLTIDGHWLYYVSGRAGGYGGTDLWVAHRKDKDDPTGWEAPKNLGPYVNTSAGETGPSIFEDEATGKTILYFTSNKKTTQFPNGVNKIYQSELLDRDNPGPVTLVPGLNDANVSVADWHAFIRRKDGLEVIFASNRGGLPQSDLFVSTRPTTSAPWSTPVNLGPLVNDPVRAEGRPSISWDGTELYFWTDREWYEEGGYWNMDVYRATRQKITGKNK